MTVWLAEAYAGFFASFVAHVMNSWAVRGAPLCLQPRTRKTRVGERERELWRSPTLLVNGRYQTGVNIRSIKATGTSMHALTQRYAPHLMHGDCTQVHHCTPTIPALYGCLQPVIGVTLSIALLGESFDARDVGSVLLIIGGLVVVTMKGLQLRGTPSATGLDSFAGFHPELPHRHLARK